MTPMKEHKKLISVIIPAAGNAIRMNGVNKTFFALGGVPVLLRCVRLFERQPMVGEIIIAVKQQDTAFTREMLAQADVRTKTVIAAGGATRQESVYNALKLSDPQLPYIAIHDAARPFCTDTDIAAVFQKARECGAAALGIPMKDTVKRAENDGRILETLPRDNLVAVQTPQVFQKELYCRAIQKAAESGADYTDDCQLIEALGKPVYIVEGSERNFKLTTQFDLAVAETVEKKENGGSRMDFRIGHGYDVHRLTKGRALILGGEEIPFEKGLDGHSDADVVAHAIMDALLGASALGDIGKHFPDTNEAYRGADSMRLMEHVVFLLRENGWQIGNIDATILAQAPKLAPYIERMRENIAHVCMISLDQVNMKATTEERLGFTGSGEGIAAHAVCLIRK